MPTVIFRSPSGAETSFEVPAGKTVLDIAWENGIEIEGACEGVMACSTCHVVVDEKHFRMLTESSQEEEDLLDLAWGLRPTSRLGCQIVIDDSLDGIVLTLPAETNNQM